MPALFLLTLLWLADDPPINPSSQQNHQAVRLFSLTHRYEHFQTTVQQRELKLKFTPIIQKTETVWIDGKQLRSDQDYKIDYDQGHIKFNLDLLPNQEIQNQNINPNPNPDPDPGPNPYIQYTPKYIKILKYASKYKKIHTNTRIYPFTYMKIPSNASKYVPNPSKYIKNI